MDERYKAMFIGIAIFVGGMVTILILKNFFNENSPAQSYQTVTLKPVDESISILSDIRDELKVEKPEGHVFNMNLNVTDQITDIYDQARHKLPWSKVDIINMGPNPIYFCVNKWDWPEAPIDVGLSINIDFQKKDSINRLFLKCDSGLSSNVRLQIVK